MRISLAFVIMIIPAIGCNDSTDHHASDESVYENLREIKSPADTASALPYLVTGRDGILYLSWIEKSGEVNYLKYALLNDTSWTSSKSIASGNNWFINWADYPQIATLDSMHMIALFMEKSDTGKYTYDIRSVVTENEGMQWTTPTLLHDDSVKAEHGFVSIVPYDDNYFVVWLDGRNTSMSEGDSHGGGHGKNNEADHGHGSMTLRAAVLDKKGAKLQEWELDEKVCDCCQTSATIGAKGPIVVYRDRSDEEVRDISILRLVDGKWTKPQKVHDDNWKINGCPVNGPKVVADGNTIAVAWYSAKDKKEEVKLAMSTNGGESFSKPIQLNEGNTIGRIDLLIAGGEVLVSWMEGATIKLSRVGMDRKHNTISVAKSSDGRSSGFPQMERSGRRIIFAWTDSKERKIRTAYLDL